MSKTHPLSSATARDRLWLLFCLALIVLWLYLLVRYPGLSD